MQIEKERETLARSAASAALFLPGGRAPRTGERLSNPQLAATLRRLAHEPGALSSGELARALVAEINAAGGNYTLADLESYAPVVR